MDTRRLDPPHSPRFLTSPDQRLTSGLGLPQLRKSCGACAASKLKCSQEQPVCARCAKRGTVCQYVAAKKGGRKPKNRPRSREHSSVDTTIPPAEYPEDGRPAPSSIHGADPLSDSSSLRSSNDMELDQHDPWRDASQPPTAFHNLLSPLYSGLPASATKEQVSFDEHYTNPRASLRLGDGDAIWSSDLFPIVDDLTNAGDLGTLMEFFPFEDTGSELSSLSGRSTSTSHTLSIHGNQPASHIPQRGRPPTLKPPCSCLEQALGAMQQLSSSAVASVEAVLVQNEAAMESTSKMLECSCSQNGYLLTIASMIMFKLLGWYAVVARQTDTLPLSAGSRSPFETNWSQERQRTPRTDQGSLDHAIVGSFCLDGADSSRMAAQLVMGKLHRVRRLIDKLSAKLVAQRSENHQSCEGVSEQTGLGREMTLPLSANVYDQMAMDLKKQIRTLSSDMIDRLGEL